MIRIEITNLADFEKKMNAFPGQVIAEAARVLREEAEEVMTRSKELVPVDTGTLRSTGHVPPTRREGNSVEVDMAYGGPAAGYAVHVHENLKAGIHWSVPGTGPKFLERPYLAALPGIPAKLIEAFKRAFR
jgi:hypothetical protein